jgi:hypothetical protein
MMEPLRTNVKRRYTYRTVTTRDELEEVTHEGPMCPSCFAPIERELDFCPECNAPLSASSTLDPVKRIYSGGEMLRRSTRMRTPSLVIVVGMWLICFPALMIAYHLVFEGEATVFGLFIVLIYGAVLYKVTTRYFAARNERALQADDDE